MPSLYCPTHGAEKSKEAKSRPASFYKGESLILTKGNLIKSGLRCDKCSKILNEGDLAYFNCSQPDFTIEDFYEYDFFREESFFGVIAFTKDNTEIFGYDGLRQTPPSEYAQGAFIED